MQLWKVRGDEILRNSVGSLQARRAKTPLNEIILEILRRRDRDNVKESWMLVFSPEEEQILHSEGKNYVLTSGMEAVHFLELILAQLKQMRRAIPAVLYAEKDASMPARDSKTCRLMVWFQPVE